MNILAYLTNNHLRWLLLFLFLLPPIQAVAGELPTSDGLAADIPSLNISGYATLAYTVDDADDMAFVREWTLRPKNSRGNASGLDTDPWLTDSRLGIQAVYQFNPSMEFVGQLTLREQEEVSLDNSLQWAFIGLHPKPNIDLRLGRVGFDGFLMSDLRQVGFAYLWVRPPVEFYGHLPVYPVDGGDITYYIPDDAGGQWSIKAQVGASDTTLPFGANSSYDFSSDLWSLSLTRETGPWHFRAGYSNITLDGNPILLSLLHTNLDFVLTNALLPPVGTAEAVSLRRNTTFDGAEMDFYSLAASYDDGTWLAQVELGNIDSSASMVGNGWEWYASIGRRMGDLTPYLAMAQVRSNSPVKTAQSNWGVLANLQAEAIAAANWMRIDQQTLSIGVRWDLQPQKALKAQWDHTRVEANGYGLWWENRNTSTDTDVNVFTISMEFLF